MWPFKKKTICSRVRVVLDPNKFSQQHQVHEYDNVAWVNILSSKSLVLYADNNGIIAVFSWDNVLKFEWAPKNGK